MEPVYIGTERRRLLLYHVFVMQLPGKQGVAVEAARGILTQPVCESAVSCTVASVNVDPVISSPSLYTSLNDKIKDNYVPYTCLKTLWPGDSLTKESGSYNFVPWMDWNRAVYLFIWGNKSL